MPDRLVTILDGAARERLVDRFGPEVAGWCDELPVLVEAVTAGWRLRVRRALRPGGTSVLYECVAGDGVPVVLKLTPDRSIAGGEAAGLRAWSGLPQVVRLLDADLERGALLLEALSPGVPLSQDPDGWTLPEILPVLAALRSPRPGPAADMVPPLRDRIDFLFDLTERRRSARPDIGHRLPRDLLDRSRRHALALAEGGPVGLVHGDLHPGNVLRTGRGPVAIDPRPCIGDPTFDTVDWILTDVTGQRDVDRRVDQLTDHLPAEPDRVLAWCQATAVLLAAGALRRNPQDPRAQVLLDIADRPAPAVPPTTRTPGPDHGEPIS
jgi:streptomycin 6-kinase